MWPKYVMCGQEGSFSVHAYSSYLAGELRRVLRELMSLLFCVACLGYSRDCWNAQELFGTGVTFGEFETLILCRTGAVWLRETFSTNAFSLMKFTILLPTHLVETLDYFLISFTVQTIVVFGPMNSKYYLRLLNLWVARLRTAIDF